MSRLRLLVLLFCVCVLGAAGAGHAASSSVVVSQVFAAGGNSGAPYTNDFVELFNRGSTAVDLTGWTVQYAPATSTSWQATPLGGTIQPGRYYLVQLASAASVGAALPTPDASGTSNLATSGGKVAVASTATVLTCGASAGSCSATPGVVDLVGYGPASDFEGSGSAPALSATTAAIRAGGGCVDTDTSSADFATGAPAPRNSSSAAQSCGGGSNPGVGQDATVRVTLQSVLALSLEKASLDFGQVAPGSTPTPLSEHVTVTSTSPAGYTLSVHRGAFAPADLPLGLSASAPPGAALGAGLAGGGLVGMPIAPAADLLLGSSTAASAAGGDVWPTSIGFASVIPSLAAGAYTATVTFTAVGR
jgi:hypothetical protein